MEDILEVINQLRARGSGGSITSTSPSMFDAWANTLEHAVKRSQRFDNIVSGSLNASFTVGKSLASEDEIDGN